VSVGDAWLSRHVPPRLRRGAIVTITFDEGEGNNHIYCASGDPAWVTGSGGVRCSRTSPSSWGSSGISGFLACGTPGTPDRCRSDVSLDAWP